MFQQDYMTPQYFQPSESYINVNRNERIISAVVGGALAVYALRRSLFNFALMGLGGALIYRAMSGHCPAYSALGVGSIQSDLISEPITEDCDLGPSVQHPIDEKAVQQSPMDDVEEASMESFPASDPPSYSKSST